MNGRSAASSFGHHAEALQERRIHAEAHHPHEPERDEPARHEADAGPARSARRTPTAHSAGEHGERAEHGQRRVDVGVGRADDRRRAARSSTS